MVDVHRPPMTPRVRHELPPAGKRLAEMHHRYSPGHPANHLRDGQLSALSLTGRDDARLYDGSLAEWSARPGLPLVAG